MLIIRITIVTLFLFYCHAGNAQTWAEWFKQKKTQRKYLLEQIAKLQLYLEFLKKGYVIAHEGLNIISDIKNGDFNLHRFFLESLQRVNPHIKRYSKVTDVITMQAKMLSSYMKFSTNSMKTECLSNSEKIYLDNLCTNIIQKTMNDVEELTNVVSDGTLQMEDNERIKRINYLHSQVTSKHNTLLSIIDRVTLLVKQRISEQKDMQTLKDMYQP